MRDWLLLIVIIIILAALITFAAQSMAGSPKHVAWDGASNGSWDSVGGNVFYWRLGGAAAPSWTPNITPVAHWNFQQTNATATLDVIASARHATNEPSVATGPTRKPTEYTNINGRTEAIYDFDGTDDRFQTPLSSGSLTLIGNYALAAWVMLDTNDSTRLIYGDAAGGRGMGMWFSASPANTWRAAQQMSTGFKAADVAVTNPLKTWVHLVMEGTRTSLCLYVNGNAPSNTAFADTGYVDNSFGMTLGCRIQDDGVTKDLFWDGFLDDFRAYTNLIGLTEVQLIYSNTRPTANIEVR